MCLSLTYFTKYNNSVTSLAPTSNSGFLDISITSAVTEVLIPLKSFVMINFWTPDNVYILFSSHESWMSLVVPRMVYPFQNDFHLLWTYPSEQSLSMAAIALQNISLK